MSDIVNKYPLDLTGRAPTHLIMGEPHVLESGINRSVVPNYGAFYVDSLVVRDADSTEILVPNDQYVPIMYYAEPSERSGKEIHTGIIITDANVSTNIVIDYQVVGGDYTNITQVIIDLIENLNIDDREVMWGDLLGRPDAFPPAQHLHDLGDLYGFEMVVQALNSVREAILLGDVASHQEIRDYIEARYLESTVLTEGVRDELNVHTTRVDNPHSVTKAQVGLGSVENFPLASQSEAELGLSNAKYMTPLLVSQAIAAQAGVALQAHEDRNDNPHSVTKAQTGLGNVDNYSTATSAEAITGLRTDRFITPETMKAAISSQAGAALGVHTSATDNPHSVTKAQVGLGSVENFPVATTEEAEAGLIDTAYMTPLKVANAISSLAATALATHTNNTSNPHSVTKAQVGLENVENFAIATEFELQNGVVTNKYTTPKLVKDAIIYHATAPLNVHTTNTSNPHSVTKAQVGLSLIPNDITSARNQNTDTKLLTAKAMYDHITGGDHDSRYVNLSGDAMTGELAISGHKRAYGVFTGVGARDYALYVYDGNASGGGVCIRANGNTTTPHAVSVLNQNNALVYYVRAIDGLAWSNNDHIITSDKRRKKNIRDIENPVEVILKTRGRIFDRKDINVVDKPGFIAQELLESIPGIVKEGEDGYYGVAETGVIPYLVEAFKVEHHKVVDLNNAVELLTDQLGKVIGILKDNNLLPKD